MAGSLARLASLEKAALVIVKRGVFRQNGVVGQISQFSAATHSHPPLICSASNKAEELHGAPMILRNLHGILRCQRETGCEQVVVADDKNLNSLVRQAQERVRDLNDHFRVHVRLRLVPKQKPVPGQRAVDDEMGENRQFPPALRQEMRLDASVGAGDVEPSPFEADFPANLLLKRLHQGVQHAVAPATKLAFAQRNANVVESLVKGQLPLLVSRDEPLKEGQNLPRGNECGLLKLADITFGYANLVERAELESTFLAVTEFCRNFRTAAPNPL